MWRNGEKTCGRAGSSGPLRDTGAPVKNTGDAGGMTRQVQVTLPAGEHALLESLRALVDGTDDARHVLELHGQRGEVFIKFSISTPRSGRVLEELAARGIGYTCGSVEVLELRTSMPRAASSSSAARADAARKRFRLTDRTWIEEIYETVDASFHLTFDFLVMVICAAIVCAVGLLDNNSTFVTASMLLSPLMNPILATTLGAVIGDWRMVRKGARNELVGVLLTFGIGVAIGVLSEWGFPLSSDVEPGLGANATLDYKAEQLHYTVDDLLMGVLIAVPSGIALALAITTVLSQMVAGVAIATSILPPIVASGINLVKAFHERPDDPDSPNTHLRYAGFGACMFAINWTCIFVGAALTLGCVKQITPDLMRHRPGSPGPSLVRSYDAPPPAAQPLLDGKAEEGRETTDI